MSDKKSISSVDKAREFLRLCDPPPDVDLENRPKNRETAEGGGAASITMSSKFDVVLVEGSAIGGNSTFVTFATADDAGTTEALGIAGDGSTLLVRE